MDVELGDGWSITTDPARMDLDLIHGCLARFYWAEGIPRHVVARSLENSLCFGVFRGGAQLGFARVITDRATFAYLADVFVLEEHRGRGLSRRLMEAVMGHPDLQGLRGWYLKTRDAHALYEKFGFTGLKSPERSMEITRPDIYKGAGGPEP